MAYSLEEIQSINRRGTAVPNKEYLGTDGAVYKGTATGYLVRVATGDTVSYKTNNTVLNDGNVQEAINNLAILSQTPSVDVTIIAGQNISSGRAVYVQGGQLFYYDATDVSLNGVFAGISVTSGSLGDAIKVRYSGLYTEAGLGLTPDVIYYAGVNGTLVTTPPSPGVMQQIGMAIDANNLYLKQNITSVETIASS